MNVIEIVAANAPDPASYERIVGQVHVIAQFDEAGGQVPAIWREVER